MSISNEQWLKFDEYIRRDMPSFWDISEDYSIINRILKGKKMTNVFNVLAIQEHADKLPTILVPITTVIAKDETIAVQNFLIENATELKGKENVQTLCRPFC